MKNQVISCSFNNITFKAIDINRILDYSIEFSSFSTCSSKGLGGCIYANCRSVLFNKNCFEYVDTDSHGTSVYISAQENYLNFTSIAYCSENSLKAIDAIYLDSSSLESKSCNSSTNKDSQSCGFQGNNNKRFVVSYLLCSDGVGWCSLEITRQKIDTYIDHIVFSNNTVSQYGVIYLFESQKLYIDNVIMTGNIGKGFTGTNVIFKDFYYNSDYQLGISGSPSGVIMINSPTMSWNYEFFYLRDCNYNHKVIFSIPNKKVVRSFLVTLITYLTIIS